MSQKNNNSSDFTKIVGSAFSSVTGVMKDVKDEFNEKIVSYLEKMDLVKREEFEVVQAMLNEARLEQEAIKKKLKALEKKLTKK
jgi:BMFP domain-containing protein YqiC